MKNIGILLAGLAIVGVGVQVAVAKGSKAADKGHVPLVKYADVQKILDKNCTSCHGAPRPRGGIDLTTYENVMKGGEDGLIVVANDPKKSPLYLAVSGATGYRIMPPPRKAPKLADKDIKTIQTWITQGAKNPK